MLNVGDVPYFTKWWQPFPVFLHPINLQTTIYKHAHIQLIAIANIAQIAIIRQAPSTALQEQDTIITTMLLLSPYEVLVKDFDACQGLLDNFMGSWTQWQTNILESHYGSSPVVIANMWYDMMHWQIAT
jgi:hypothetical protein